MMRFRSTPPRRGRPFAKLRFKIASTFRSTPPRRGRRASVTATSSCPKFRSTPPRRGRRRCDLHNRAGRGVSIHAPAKGATWRDKWVHVRDGVSIHAPAKGATTPCPFAPSAIPVSIHAPAKGATSSRSSHARTSGRFRSTPPRRGRLGSPITASTQRGFDPRPREGGDQPPETRLRAERVSIHAPAKGATKIRVNVREANRFRSTPPRRGRRKVFDRPTRWTLTGFDPRPREGGDLGVSARMFPRRGFDPRPREGGDRGGGGRAERR